MLAVQIRLIRDKPVWIGWMAEPAAGRGAPRAAITSRPGHEVRGPTWAFQAGLQAMHREAVQVQWNALVHQGIQVGEPAFYRAAGQTRGEALASAALYWNDSVNPQWPADGGTPPAAVGIPRIDLDEEYLATHPEELLRLAFFLRLVDRADGPPVATAGGVGVEIGIGPEELMLRDDEDVRPMGHPYYWMTSIGRMEVTFRAAYQCGAAFRQARVAAADRVLDGIDTAAGWRIGVIGGAARLNPRFPDLVDVRDADEPGQGRNLRKARRRAVNYLRAEDAGIAKLTAICGIHLE